MLSYRGYVPILFTTIPERSKWNHERHHTDEYIPPDLFPDWINFRYGKSNGSPSEQGIRMDAQAALDYLLEHPVSKNNKIILYGQSIGGAVAIDLASRNQANIAAVILENTFLSVVCVPCI
jgi:dienelactone hydrolase